MRLVKVLDTIIVGIMVILHFGFEEFIILSSKFGMTFSENSSNICIGNLFDTFLKLLYLINYSFIRPRFASFFPSC